MMGRAGWDDGPNAMGGARRGGWGDERDANVGGGCMGSDNWRGPGRGGPNGGMYSGGPTGGAWGNFNRAGLGHPERGRGGIRGGRENWGRGIGWSPRGNRGQPPPPPSAPGMPIFPDPNAWGPIAPPPSVAAQFQRHVVQQQPQPNVHLMNSKGQGVVQNPATCAPMPSDSAPPLPSDAPPLPPDGDGSNGTAMDPSQMSQQMAAWQMSMMGGMWEPNAMIMAAMMGGGVPPQGDHMDMQAQQIAAMQMAMAGGMMPQMGGAPPAAQPGEDSMDTSN